WRFAVIQTVIYPASAFVSMQRPVNRWLIRSFKTGFNINTRRVCEPTTCLQSINTCLPKIPIKGRVNKYYVERLFSIALAQMRQAIQMLHNSAIRSEQLQVFAQAARRVRVAFKHPAGRRATGKRLQTQRSRAGKQIEAARARKLRSQPVKQGFADTVAGWTQPFHIGKAQFASAPLATDNAQLIWIPGGR